LLVNLQSISHIVDNFGITAIVCTLKKH